MNFISQTFCDLKWKEKKLIVQVFWKKILKIKLELLESIENQRQTQYL